MSDIVIIGGGIAGLSAGARLSADARVTVLEQENAPGYHASGRSAAMFEENYGLPSTIALNTASAPYHHEANGGYLSPRGFLITAMAHEEDTFAQDAETLGAPAISCERACTLVPILNADKLAFAGYHEDAFDIDTDRMMQDFAREIRANKGAVVTGAQVTGLRQTAQGWHIDTGKGPYEATCLVNAAGAWADQIASMAGIAPLGIVPHRRSMARLAAPGGHDLRHWPMFLASMKAGMRNPTRARCLSLPQRRTR